MKMNQKQADKYMDKVFPKIPLTTAQSALVRAFGHGYMRLGETWVLCEQNEIDLKEALRKYALFLLNPS